MTISGKSGNVNVKGNITATKFIGPLQGNADTASKINTRGTITAEAGTTKPLSGLSMQNAYNNGYPDAYGNVLNLKGSGASQLFLGWMGAVNTSSTSASRGRIFYRSMRDYTGDGTVWSSWGQIFTGVTLYDNSSGTTGTVTLSETAANFSYLEIYYFSDLNNDYGSVRIASPNGKKFRVSWNEMSKNSLNTDSYTFGTQFQVNGTSISVYNTAYGIINLGNATFYKENRTKIYKVIGYR